MKRSIITIDEDKCTGCSLCIPNCPEGALQIIDGKARLVSDLFCDGLGACLGHCPEGAISVVEREAEEYDEYKVMGNVVKGGKNVVIAHLEHLKSHGQDEYFAQALDFLKRNGFPNPLEQKPAAEPHQDHSHGGHHGHMGCPGSRMMQFNTEKTHTQAQTPSAPLSSELRQWPVQLQLLNPQAPYFDNADLVVAADCVPFAYPNFHQRFLKDKTLVVFCPKLDHTIEQYVDKLAQIFRTKNIKSVTLVHMEVPCCFGVESVVRTAMEKAGKNITLKDYTISLQGEII
ncbi:MAG: 4Fe-4S binding protein [Firmicutes bacterium]|nr:4Fe-4S binding protein [Bacillota bacterium]